MNRAERWISLEAGDIDEAVARAEWLERALVGLELATVISELNAIAGRPARSSGGPAESARSWLGSDATAVLRKGLGVLPTQKVDELFRNPELLADLQELLLTEGGAHWDALVRGNDRTDKLAARQWYGIAGRLGMDTTKARGSAAGISMRTRDASPQWHRGTSTDGGRQFRRLISVALPLTLAAAALVVVIPVWLQRITDDHAVPKFEGVSIVNVIVPEPTAAQDDPAGLDIDALDGESWPEHPWKTMVASAPGGGTLIPRPGNESVAGPKKKLLAESRQWTRKLESTHRLTATQARVAVERARGAIKAIDGLASEGALGLGDDLGTRLRAKCSVAVEELDHVKALLEKELLGDRGVVQARRDIVRVLGDVEATLETNLTERTAPDAPAF
jgi:hypothetical protein